MQEIDIRPLIKMLNKWKKLLVISIIFLSVASVIVSLIVPLTYTSGATIIPPGGGSVLDNFLPTSMVKGLGGLTGSSPGGSNNGENKTMSILMSRELAENTINEFGLKEQYGSQTIEDAINAFRDNFSILLTEQRAISISFNMQTEYFHPDENELYVRKRVKDIAQFIIDELDRKYTFLETQRARYQRIIIERRYNQNINDIERLEKEIAEFSSKYGVFDFEFQIQAQIEALYSLEARLIEAEIQKEIFQFNYSESNQQVVNQKQLITSIKDKINDLIRGDSNSEYNIRPTLESSPELGRQFIKLQRELAIQNVIYEFINQQYEQVKIQEAKDTPSLQYIDTPVVPTKRTSPSRALMVISLCFIGFFIVICYITIIEFFDRRKILTQLK